MYSGDDGSHGAVPQVPRALGQLQTRLMEDYQNHGISLYISESEGLLGVIQKTQSSAIATRLDSLFNVFKQR